MVARTRSQCVSSSKAQRWTCECVFMQCCAPNSLCSKLSILGSTVMRHSAGCAGAILGWVYLLVLFVPDLGWLQPELLSFHCSGLVSACSKVNVIHGDWAAVVWRQLRSAVLPALALCRVKTARLFPAINCLWKLCRYIYVVLHLSW